MRFSVSAAVLLIVTWGAFAPAVGYPFVYEDAREARLTLNPEATSHQIYMQPYRALTYASRHVDMTLFGIQPWGFHLGAVLWHGLNVLILFAVAWLIFPPWGAVLAAGVFAWHPVQIEAVAYVSARADLISTVGVLLALLAASLGSVAGAVVGVVLACLGKEAAIVAGALVPLWAAWTRAPLHLGKYAAVVGGLAIAGVVLMGRDLTEWSVVLNPTLAGEQLATIWRLLALIVAPIGQTVDHDWQSLRWLGGAALVLSVGLTVWSIAEGWPRRHWLAFGWLWTLVALSPRLVVPLYEGLHEHHLYFPMIGWALCAGHWLTVRDARRSEQWH